MKLFLTISHRSNGKLKGYDFILNSNNNQTVLAGNKDKDVTKELLNFINEKYEGF